MMRLLFVLAILVLPNLTFADQCEQAAEDVRDVFEAVVNADTTEQRNALDAELVRSCKKFIESECPDAKFKTFNGSIQEGCGKRLPKETSRYSSPNLLLKKS